MFVPGFVQVRFTHPLYLQRFLKLGPGNASFEDPVVLFGVDVVRLVGRAGRVVVTAAVVGWGILCRARLGHNLCLDFCFQETEGAIVTRGLLLIKLLW